MPSTIDNSEIKLTQLIPPRPQLTRGKPFPLSGSEDWFIYPQGKNVYLYNLKDSSLSKEYREHAYQVGVAKLSPSHAFIASGDQCGNLRVWSVETLETKLEVRVLGGKIADLQWSEDEKYIAVCGEGRDQFANVIKVDGGASFGELTGPSKPCPSIALHSSHLLLASDDKSLTIYRASPTYKFVRTLRDHDNFVQVVGCSGDGKMFASAGADGKVNVYTFENNYALIAQVKAHDTGIFAMEWIDNQTLLTASSDKSLKLWHVPEGTLICQSEVLKEWNFEKQICGIKVIGSLVLVLRLDGSIEMRTASDLKIADKSYSLAGIGHSKGVVDLITEADGTIHSVSYDGNIKTWKQQGSKGNYFCADESNFSSKNVQKLANSTLAVSENKIITREGETEMTAKIVGFSNEIILTADGNVISNGKILKNLGKESIELAVFASDILVAFSGSSLKFYNQIYESIQSFDDIPAKITAMSFNPSSTSLAVADDQRRIKLYTKSPDNNWTRQSCQWCNHAARIDTLLWLDEVIILSAGVDGHIMAWSHDANKIGPIKMIKSAHSSPINKLTKIGDGMFASAASDCCIKTWEFKSL